MTLAIARSALVCLVRASVVPFGGLVLLTAWPLLVQAFAPGITSRHTRDGGRIYEFAFIASVLGAVAGLSTLNRLQPAFHRTAARWRAGMGFLLVCLVGGLAGAWIVAAEVAFLPGAARGADWTSLAPPLGVSVLHVSAIAVALVASPLPASVRSVALIAIAWLIPAILPDTFAQTALLRAMPPSHWTASRMEFEPILAWLAVALLLEVTRTHRA